MSAIKYAAGYLIPLVAAVTLFVGGPWLFLTPIIIFGILPVFELINPGSTENPEGDAERERLAARIYDWVLYAALPIQYGVLALGITLAAMGRFSGYEYVGVILSLGMCCGVLGINAAHELGHRRKKSEQRMAKALLFTSLYMHFFIEHNRGHHARVATEEDPASARLGENLYTFFVRSMIFSWLSAWELEFERLDKQGKKRWGLENEMLRYQLIQVAGVAAVALLAGPVGALVFMAAALVGGLLLENVNYIEHYGLMRAKQEGGGYERTLPIHSWNSNHPLGRIFLFELSRHSDHHAHARRRYQVLRHFEESPQLPTGYPGMMLLAWLPPLWFAVMHRHIEAERNRIQSSGHEVALEPLAA